MFRKERPFNIITGQLSLNPPTQRSRSCASQLQKFQRIETQRKGLLKLGVPKDKDSFKYSYINSERKSQLPSLSSTKDIKKLQQVDNKSMLNFVSTGYNIINHTQQFETASVVNSPQSFKKMPSFFVKSPLTQHIRKNRVFSTNFQDNYSQKAQQHQFNRKLELCTNLCEVSKSYGTNKFFRKYK